LRGLTNIGGQRGFGKRAARAPMPDSRAGASHTVALKALNRRGQASAGVSKDCGEPFASGRVHPYQQAECCHRNADIKIKG